jgi:hypothetical protein
VRGDARWLAKRWSRPLISVTAFLSFSACETPTAVPFPTVDAVAYDARPEYAYWWSLVEQCSGRSGDLSAIHWYRAPGDSIVVGDGVYDGFWWREGERILVARDLRDDGPLIRHEMLHALLGDGQHPLEFFAKRCAGVVRFDATADFGADLAREAHAPIVRASDVLAVTIVADPQSPGQRENGGYFTLRVTARSTASTPVWVELVDGYVADYVYREDGHTGGVMTTSARRIFFEPGQERQVTLDGRVFSPGSVHVRGGYGDARSAWLPVTFVP